MMEKKEREQNDLAEGPRSKTEWNDFKILFYIPIEIFSLSLNLKSIVGNRTLCSETGLTQFLFH